MELLRYATSDCVTEPKPCFDFLHSIFCFGVFDGAEAALQGSPDGEEWFMLAVFTAKGVVGIGIALHFLRASLTKAGAATCVHLIVN